MTDPSPDLRLSQPPVATAAMLVRAPVERVFEALVDPAVTTRFWFTKSSGRLEPGAHVEWEWEMYGASVGVTVTAVEPNQRLAFAWETGDEPTTVDWRFTARADGTTFVTVTSEGFAGDGDEQVAEAIGVTEGFVIVLAGLKALLEHDLGLNLVADRFPDGIDPAGPEGTV